MAEWTIALDCKSSAARLRRFESSPLDYLLQGSKLLDKERTVRTYYIILNMDSDLEKLQLITPLLAKLVDGNNLTSEEAEKVFTTTFLYDKDGYYSAVLMAAIHAKGETADELLGFVNMYKNTSVHLALNTPINQLTDLSGTGGGSFIKQ